MRQENENKEKDSTIQDELHSLKCPQSTQKIRHMYRLKAKQMDVRLKR